MKNRTQKVWKRITALLVVFVMLLALPVWQASAAWNDPPRLDEPCTIEFLGFDGALAQEAEDYRLSMVMDVFQLAIAEEDGNGYTLTGLEAFAWQEWGRIKNGKADPSLRDELANRAAERIAEGVIEPICSAVPLGEAATNLSAGAYLCFLHEAGEENWLSTFTENGATAIVSKVYGRDHDHIISPSLVILPVDENDGGTTAVGPIWNYTDGISFKPKQLAGDEITIYKRDADSDLLLSGATFNLYCSRAQANEDFLSVNANGEEIPLFLMYSGTTDNSGTVSFPTPYPDALYALVETQAPSGYLPSEEPYFFYIPSIKEWAERTGQSLDSITANVVTVNTYTNSSEELSIEDVNFAGWTYRYVFKNETDRDVLIRAKAFVSDIFGVTVKQKHWELKSDGYYYYKYPLGPGETLPIPDDPEDTHELLIQLELSEGEVWDANEYGLPPIALVYECVAASSNPQWKNVTSGAYYPEVLTDPVITIYNDLNGEELPETGGRGTAALYWTGGLLTAGAALLLADRKRRKNASV